MILVSIWAPTLRTMRGFHGGGGQHSWRTAAFILAAARKPVTSDYPGAMEGRGDLVSGLILEITGVIIWLIGVINQLTKSPWPSKYPILFCVSYLSPPWDGAWTLDPKPFGIPLFFYYRELTGNPYWGS